jgi:hypothetical protein
MTDNNDKLHSHIAGLIAAFSERLPRDQTLRQRNAQVRRPQAGDDKAALQRWADQSRAIFDDTLGDMYQRIELHSSAILKLTTDPHIVSPVGKLAKLAKTELDDARALIGETVNAADPSARVALVLKMLGVGLRGLPRQGQIEAALAELEPYNWAA